MQGWLSKTMIRSRNVRFSRPYTSHYQVYGGPHPTFTLQFKVCQRSAVCHSLFVSWHHLEVFVVPPRKRHCYHVQGSPSWGALGTHCMLCAPAPPMVMHYSGAFENDGQPFSRLHDKTARVEFTVMSLVCFVCTAEIVVPNLCLSCGFRAWHGYSCHGAKKKIHILLLPKVKATPIFQGLLTMFWDCKVELVLALWAYAWMIQIDWSDSEVLDWYP